MAKFEFVGRVSNVKNKTLARRSITTENILTVVQNPYLSIPRHCIELGVQHTSLDRALHKDLDLKSNEVKTRSQASRL